MPRTMLRKSGARFPHSLSNSPFTILALAALPLLCSPAAAHHAFSAEFDINQPIQLSGEVIRLVFSNPHSYIYLKVTTATGEEQEWAIEGGAPNALIRRGWDRNSLPAGTKVTVLGYRSRDGEYRASGGAVTLPDGRELDAASSGIGAPPGTE
jgi:hypothetical protein